MFTEGARRSTSPRDRRQEALENQYKPLGLKAVLAAASQRKPEGDKPAKGEPPACLKDMEEA